MLQLWSSLSVASKRLVAAGAGLLLTMVAVVSLTMWDLRRVTLEDARESVGKLGIAIAEQTARSVQAVDLMLQDTQRHIVSLGLTTPDQFTTALRSQELETVLRRQEEAMPQTNAFTIVSADGHLVNFSRRWPIPALDLSDRDYFKYFRVHDDPNVFMTKPVRNRGDGTWTIYIARRVDGPGGTFLGLVLGAIDLRYFQTFYQALTVGSGTSVTLLARNGTDLASFPITGRAGDILPPTSPWHGVVAKGRPAILVTRGIFTRGMRIVSVHPLADYPLVVDVSVSMDSALADWRRAAVLAALGTASAVLCVILLLRALILQLQRLETSESSLAEQNLSLVASRRRIEGQARALQESQKHLAETSTALKTTLEHMSQGIMMVDGEHRVMVFNTQAIQLLGLPAGLVTPGCSFDDIAAYQHASGEFADPRATGDPITGEFSQPLLYQRRRPNGRVLEVQSVPLPDGGMVRTYTDITERRLSEERIRYFAHHDDLTKLVNRVVFQERLAEAIKVADLTGLGIAVLYMDLDRFKLVNDSRGHNTGDKLLVEVARRLRETVRDIDTVARMGGDEFAIIQPLTSDPMESVKFAERVLRLMRQPFDVEGALCRVGMSIGIARYPDHASDGDTLLRNADVALYRAKAEGRGIACVFEENMDTRQQALFALEQELRQALDLRQFDIEYQPILDVESRQVTSFEALLRWRHPERGTIPPGDFITLAENSGIITPIGLWVLETACAEAATWPESVRIAVNLSPVQFNHESLTQELTGILRRTGLRANRLVLEVTEGLLLQETSTVLGIMSRLKALGIRFALDDFGTGYAGLGYLRRFPFDAIKIDKLFVKDMVQQPEGRAVVAALLEIGAALKLSVVAEGVETEAQLAELALLRCKFVQGYLIGRPASALVARRIIAENSAPDSSPPFPG